MQTWIFFTESKVYSLLIIKSDIADDEVLGYPFNAWESEAEEHT